MPDDGGVLYFDGACAMCARAVRVVLAHEGRDGGGMRFAPLQGEHGQTLRAAHPWLRGVDSVVFVPYDGAAPLVRWRAVRAVLRRLAQPWRTLGWLGSVVPAPLADLAYDQVAKRRSRWFGACEWGSAVPPGTERRFLS